MKRKTKIILCIALPVILLSLLFTGLTKAIVFPDNNATLTFIYGDKNIVHTLSDAETENIRKILSTKNPDYFLLPACGFDKNISISFGNQTFSFACDGCNIAEISPFTRHIDITEEETEYIHSLFEKYGGFFPCN